jgi:hypothetical protein
MNENNLGELQKQIQVKRILRSSPALPDFRAGILPSPDFFCGERSRVKKGAEPFCSEKRALTPFFTFFTDPIFYRIREFNQFCVPGVLGVLLSDRSCNRKGAKDDAIPPIEIDNPIPRRLRLLRTFFNGRRLQIPA